MKTEMVPFGLVTAELKSGVLYLGAHELGGPLFYVDFSARSPTMSAGVGAPARTSPGGLLLCVDGVPVEAPTSVLKNKPE